MSNDLVCDGCHEAVGDANMGVLWKSGHALCMPCWASFTPFERLQTMLLSEMRDMAVDSSREGLVRAASLTAAPMIKKRDPNRTYYKLADIPDECPKCGSGLVRRKGPFGAFFGCESYPDCRKTYALEEGE